jgi:trehalose-6-phosphatase
LCLFDVDGTLVVPRNVHNVAIQLVKRNMIDTLKELHKHTDVAIVGGSDLKKIEESLTSEGIQLFNSSA